MDAYLCCDESMDTIYRCVCCLQELLFEGGFRCRENAVWGEKRIDLKQFKYWSSKQKQFKYWSSEQTGPLFQEVIEEEEVKHWLLEWLYSILLELWYLKTFIYFFIMFGLLLFLSFFFFFTFWVIHFVVENISCPPLDTRKKASIWLLYSSVQIFAVWRRSSTSLMLLITFIK